MYNCSGSLLMHTSALVQLRCTVVKFISCVKVYNTAVKSQISAPYSKCCLVCVWCIFGLWLVLALSKLFIFVGTVETYNPLCVQRAIVAENTYIWTYVLPNYEDQCENPLILKRIGHNRAYLDLFVHYLCSKTVIIGHLYYF